MNEMDDDDTPPMPEHISEINPRDYPIPEMPKNKKDETEMKETSEVKKLNEEIEILKDALIHDIEDKAKIAKYAAKLRRALQAIADGDMSSEAMSLFAKDALSI